MRGECRASGDGSLYTVPSCELSDVKTKIMLIPSAQLPCGAGAVRCGRRRRATDGRPARRRAGRPSVARPVACASPAERCGASLVSLSRFFVSFD